MTKTPEPPCDCPTCVAGEPIEKELTALRSVLDAAIAAASALSTPDAHMGAILALQRRLAHYTGQITALLLDGGVDASAVYVGAFDSLVNGALDMTQLLREHDTQKKQRARKPPRRREPHRSLAPVLQLVPPQTSEGEGTP